MRRICLDIDGHSSHAAAKTSRSDPETVDLLQHLFFQVTDIGHRRFFFQISRQGMFRHQGTLFKRAADADSHHHRRTGIRSCIADSLQDLLFYSLNAVRRL